MCLADGQPNGSPSALFDALVRTGAGSAENANEIGTSKLPHGASIMLATIALTTTEA